MISNAAPGVLTQGTIFSCAIAEDYEGCAVHGMVITARCDITNDKAEVFNFVPVVTFDDWLHRDGVRVLAQRVSKEAMGSLKICLKQLEFASSILGTMAPSDVLKTMFDAEDATAKVKAQRGVFEKNCLRYQQAQACLTPSYDPNAASVLLASEEAAAGRIIKELCQNAVAEAYFLPGVAPDEDCPGYVVLLREIRHIPRALAAGIARGLDAASYAALCESDARNGGRISILGDDFSWPTGVVQSPFIEHLMQRLSLLFSRIGVTDVSDEIVRRLQARVPQAKGTD